MTQDTMCACLVGGFNVFFKQPYFGEIIQSDGYFRDVLKTSIRFYLLLDDSVYVCNVIIYRKVSTGVYLSFP